MGYNNKTLMENDLKESYNKACNTYNLDINKK